MTDWPHPNKPPEPEEPAGSNFLTEAVAETKICPVRTHLHMETPPASGYPNATGWDQMHPYCSASACMWWRWAKSPPAPADTGYCGAAGAPP